MCVSPIIYPKCKRAGIPNTAFTTTYSNSLQLNPTPSNSPRLYHDSLRICSPGLNFELNLRRISIFDIYLTLYLIEKRFDTKIRRFRYENIYFLHIAIFFTTTRPEFDPQMFFFVIDPVFLN